MTHPVRPYQVCLYVGPTAPELAGVRVVDLTPADLTVEAITQALADSNLTASDMRARVLFVADGGSDHLPHAILAYAAVIGLARRRVDVTFTVHDGSAFPMSDFDTAARTMPAARPAEPIALAQVGGTPREDIPHVNIDNGLSAAATSTLKYARTLRFAPGRVPAIAFPQFVAVAALRARPDSERLPLLSTGDEPADNVGGVDLEAARRAGEQLRRQTRTDNRGAIAPRTSHDGYAALVRADSVPVSATLIRLGARSRIVELPARPGTPEHETGALVPTEVWHCPRPDRHNNGDQNPSARIEARDEHELFRCFRCDPERIGSLRLVMDTLSMTGAEAADWLLAS